METTEAPARRASGGVVAALAGELGLPAPFPIAGFDGSVEEWLRRCQWQFEAIVDGHIRVLGRPVVASGNPEKTFWHAVTGDVGWSASRWLDLRRCAIMGQVWDLLERLADGDPRACWWREGHGRRKTLVVAPVDFRFVVVLRESGGYLYFVTAYPQGRRRVARLMERAAREIGLTGCGPSL